MTTEQEDKQAEPVETVSVATPVPPRAVSPWVKLMLTIAVGSVAWGAYVALQWRQEARSELDDLRAKVLLMTTQQEHSSTQLNATTANLQVAEQHRSRLEQQMHAILQSNQTTRSNDWMLLKARYYLELAQINTIWGSDVQTTRRLLTQADGLLTENHEQPVLEVRRVIAQEIATIQSEKPVDVAGLLSQLDAAQERVNALKARLIPGEGLQASSPAEKDSPVPSGWRARLQESLHALEKLVVVKRLDVDAQPFVTPAYAALLRGRIQLALQEVQLAVLQRNETLYQLMLKQALQLVNQSFDPKDANTRALLQQLAEFQQQTVAQKKINIGQALLLLNQVIDVSQDMKQEDKLKADAVVPEEHEAGEPVS